MTMLHNSKKQPIVFFGSSHFVLPIIELLQQEYDLKLVVTTEKNPTDAIPAYCSKNTIPFVSVATLSQLKTLYDHLSVLRAPVAVLAYFGLIIPQSLIDIFPKGIVNIHPSRLPHYRGSTPGQTALVLGDVKTGVSIMLLDKDVDHGPVFIQEEETISPTETATSLYEKLFAKGTKLLKQVLPAYLHDTMLPTAQDHSHATFTKPLTRESGFINPDQPLSPSLLDRTIRAYYPWPGVWTKIKINNKEVRIKFLPGKVLQVEGKKPISYHDFMHGYPEGEKILKNLNLIA